MIALFSKRVRPIWLVMAVSPFLVLLLSLSIGQTGLPLMLVVRSLLAPTGLVEAPDELSTTVVWTLRLPRAVLAGLCGAGLSVAGAALQGTLRNPLVGPQNVGVLSGAGLGGALGLMMGAGEAGVMGLAFVFGLGATLMVISTARSIQGPSILMLILSGMVISALFTALTTLVQYLADPERQLPSLIFWLMGSFSAADAKTLVWVVVPVLLGITVLQGYAFRLNVLSSGEQEARTLGLRVARDRFIVLMAIAVISAAVVGVAGLVAWVGLVVPHFARMAVGPDHRLLLPASALIGAAYLMAVDTFCRAATTAEIPLGAATALLGAPIFLWLLKRTQGHGWRTN